MPLTTRSPRSARVKGDRLDFRSRRRAAALIVYFDTSALIKLVIIEDGSELAAELWNSAYPAAASILAYPEGRAALAAGRRGGRLTAKGHARAFEDFESLQSRLISIGVDDALARHAGEHAEEFGLRGYDAVHLATALGLGDEDVVMVTWDTDLRRAAEQVGLGVPASA